MIQQLLSFEPRQKQLHTPISVSTASPSQPSENEPKEPDVPDAPWGRIISVSNRLRVFGDIKKPVTSFGRSHRCDVQLGNGTEELWISTKHFVIYKNFTKEVGERSGSSHGDGDDDDDDDDDDDNMNVEDTRIEDTSTHGTWLNGVLIGKGKSMSLTDGDLIGLRVPRRDSKQPRDHNTITIIFRKFNSKCVDKVKRCSIPDDTHPIRKKYDFLNTLGE